MAKLKWFILFKMRVFQRAFLLLLRAGAFHDPKVYGPVWELVRSEEEREIVKAALVALVLHGAASFVPPCS